MKTVNLINLFKTNSLVIPNILLINYKKLNLTEKELIFLSYLTSLKDLTLDVEQFSKDLSFEIEELMFLLASLEEKRILEMVVKNENNLMKEYLSLDHLYSKLVDYVVLDEEEVESSNSKIYTDIEKEFGRTLSPIEYETISHWIESKIDEELIYEALKEAVLNGVTNLKYIDKILYEWNRKGYRKKTDIKREVKEEKDIFSYDWLIDDGEYK